MTYTYKYEQWDFGTERQLTVYENGREIGACDPFWNLNGIPVSEAEHKGVCQQAARQIIFAYLRQKEQRPC